MTADPLVPTDVGEGLGWLLSFSRVSTLTRATVSTGPSAAALHPMGGLKLNCSDVRVPLPPSGTRVPAVSGSPSATFWVSLVDGDLEVFCPDMAMECAHGTWDSKGRDIPSRYCLRDHLPDVYGRLPLTLDSKITDACHAKDGYAAHG